MDKKEEKTLKKDLSMVGAWAFALGTSVGWGSLVVTSNTYLKQAGPLGSVLGLIVGALIMLAVGRSFAYMIECYPNAGGPYGFCKEVFGHDHGFLAAWFLALTYLAMLWANATSLPLFARYFLGNVFSFGKMYSLFGYDVYFGEALLSALAVMLASFLCIKWEKISRYIMIAMVILFSLGITLCFVSSLIGNGLSFEPLFVSEGSAFSQVIRIAAISPWAFIGFENISLLSEEYSFKQGKVHTVLVTAIVTTTLLYVFVLFLSVSAHPVGYENWLQYINDLDSLSGNDALPPFFAAGYHMGKTGVIILMISLLCLILTSLIGNITALSRLIYSLGKDEILPAKFSDLNHSGTPQNAILLVCLISVLIPLLGRTAIGWIVDVTTLGATMIYGFVSAAAMKTARFRNDVYEYRTGQVGLLAMIAIGAYLLIPNLFTAGSIETESYFLFVVWSVLGFIGFRIVLKNDVHKHFGKSIIVWVALLSLILFVSLVWMNQSIMWATGEGLANIEHYYSEAGNIGIKPHLIEEQLKTIRLISARSIIVVVSLFALSLGILLNNYDLMSRQVQNSERQLGLVRDMAHRDPLTGVKSKLAYAEKEEEIKNWIASGEAEEFSLAICDVNGLKMINDTNGHKAGDEYIKKACHMICEQFENSPVYRIGGDEFLVIVAGEDHEDREKIRAVLHELSVHNIGTNEAVVSVGIADYVPGSGMSYNEVFEKADERMYEEKKLLKSMGAAVRI